MRKKNDYLRVSNSYKLNMYRLKIFNKKVSMLSNSKKALYCKYNRIVDKTQNVNSYADTVGLLALHYGFYAISSLCLIRLLLPYMHMNYIKKFVDTFLIVILFLVSLTCIISQIVKTISAICNSIYWRKIYNLLE